MYLKHFGLEQLPFTLTPDTEFFLDYGIYKDALDVLRNALFTGEGFTKVTGEVGTGKTLLCWKLLNALDDSFVTAFIPNPSIKPRALYMALADELGIKYSYKISQPRMLQLINGRIMALHAEGKQVVLLMDEAQSLPDDSMEALRLLSNLETEKKKLLQLVLFGQPELDTRLQQDHLRQLRQRTLVSYTLQPLAAEALNVYVQHRLHVAGYRGVPLFSPKALTLLQRGSRGVPRLINVLANKAMLVAFGQGDRVIGALHIRKAIADTEDIKTQRQRLTERVVSVSTAGVFIAVVFAGFLPSGTARIQLAQAPNQACLETTITSMSELPLVSVNSIVDTTLKSNEIKVHNPPEPNSLSLLSNDPHPRAEKIKATALLPVLSANNLKTNYSASIEVTHSRPSENQQLLSDFNEAAYTHNGDSFTETEQQLENLLSQDNDQPQTPNQSHLETAAISTSPLLPVSVKADIPPEPSNSSSQNTTAQPRTAKSKASAAQPRTAKSKASAAQPRTAKSKASAAQPRAAKSKASAAQPRAAKSKASAAQPRTAKSKVSTAQPPESVNNLETNSSASIEVTHRPLTEEQQLFSDFNVAASTYNKGNFTVAERQLEDLLARDSGQHQARLLLARLYAQQQLNSRAESVLSNGLLHYPKNADYASLYAQMLAAQGRDREAINALQNALPSARENANFHALLAGLHQRTGNSTAAIASYLIALRLEPEHGEWWIGLGISNDQSGDWDTATNAYREALQHPLAGAVEQYAEQRLQQLAAKNTTSKNQNNK